MCGLSADEERKAVDRQLAETSAARKEYFAEIDCKLQLLFQSANCAIHDSIFDFMGKLEKESSDDNEPIEQLLDEWVNLSVVSQNPLARPGVVQSTRNVSNDGKHASSKRKSEDLILRRIGARDS